MPVAREPILIAGGGIGGLCAAIGLQAKGRQVVVLERREELREVGAGLTLFPNALAALDRLGVGAAVRALSVPVGDGGVRSPSGRWLLRQSADRVTASLGEPVVCVHRAELLSVLAKAADRSDVRLGAEVAAYRQDDRGVTVETSDGETLEGGALVGADGVHSVVARTMHPGMSSAYTGCTAWRAITDLPSSLASGHLGFETWGVGGAFGIVPVGEQRVYWFATANRPEAERAVGREYDEVLRRFGAWHEPIGAVLEATDPTGIIRQDMYDRAPLSSWTAGRVCVLGDAAHPMRPNLGQGACQAIEDSVALSDCVGTFDNVIDALRAYEQRRRRSANRVAALSRSAGRVVQLRRPLACHIRNTALRMIPSSLLISRIRSIAASPEV
ncbi:MAG: FAD-dependent monooxygenase [Actinobacteria bacterium]|nr:FAD-dependent monooxygenase [Actinomycetota bacterium]